MPKATKKGPCNCGGVTLEANGAPIQLADYPWDQCIADQKKRGYSDESAAKICGYIKAKNAEGVRVTAEDAERELGLTAPRKKSAYARVTATRDPIRLVPVMASLTPPSDGRPKWIQVAAAGGYNGYSGGEDPFVLTKDDLQTMVDNFHAHPSFRAGAAKAGAAELARGDYDVIPFDWRHASEKQPSNPEAQAAYAWALDLEVRDGANGAELWALVRYLDRIVPLIKGGSIKSTSIAAWPHALDPVSGEDIGWYISSIAFTNDPFIQGMQRIPIAATRGVQADGGYYGGAVSGPEEALCALKHIFGLNELSGLGDVMGNLARLRAAAMAPPPGVDVDGMIGSMRKAFNLPALSSTGDVLAEADKLLGALAAAQKPMAPAEPPSAYAEGGVMSEALKRIAQSLGVGGEVITAARGPNDLEGPVFAEVAKLQEIRRQVFDALGVSQPGECAAKLAELIRAKQLLDEIQPQVAEMKRARLEAEERQRNIDVEMAIAQHQLPNTPQMRKTLAWRHKSDPQGFASDYPIAPTGMSYLTQSIATAPSHGAPPVHVQASQHVHSPVLQRLEASGAGVAFRQGAPMQPDAPPGQGAVTVDLSRFQGRNDTERAMSYIRTNGGEKLSFDECHEQASRLLASMRRGGGRAA